MCIRDRTDSSIGDTRTIFILSQNHLRGALLLSIGISGVGISITPFARNTDSLDVYKRQDEDRTIGR